MTAKAILIGLVVLLVVVAIVGYMAGWLGTGERALPNTDVPAEERIVPDTERAIPAPE